MMILRKIRPVYDRTLRFGHHRFDWTAILFQTFRPLLPEVGSPLAMAAPKLAERIQINVGVQRPKKEWPFRFLKLKYSALVAR